MTAQQRNFVESLLQLRPFFQSHPHHLTLESPWPILTSGAVLAMLSSAALWFNGLQYSGTFLILGMISTVSAIILWWADAIKEGTYLGHHTKVVQNNIALGIGLFIVTEAALFVSLFWALKKVGP
jgi:cytochrome c oxidase subunit 3